MSEIGKEACDAAQALFKECTIECVASPSLADTARIIDSHMQPLREEIERLEALLLLATSHSDLPDTTIEPKGGEMSKKKRMVVVTTNRRGVFHGELVVALSADNRVVLKDARMCVYWPKETKGVVGLANQGPPRGARVTPSTPHIELTGVTSVMDATDSASLAWGKEPWS